MSDFDSNDFLPTPEFTEDHRLYPHNPNVHKPSKDHIAIRCLIMRETDKAILVEIASQHRDPDLPNKSQYWFPLSQVSYINNIQDVMNAHGADSEDGRYTDTLHVAKWLCDKNGLEY